MTPKAIIAVLDKTGSRIHLGNGVVEWKTNRSWYAQFDNDNQPLCVGCEMRKGVWTERWTKFPTAHLPA